MFNWYRAWRHMHRYHWCNSTEKCMNSVCALHDPAATAAFEALKSLRPGETAERARLVAELERLSTVTAVR